MARGTPRPPSRWAPIAAFGGVILGVLVAVYFAFHTVETDGARTEGCGQPALSIVLNGDGANQVVGNARRGYHSVQSDCYHAAQIDVILAVAALLAPFAIIAIAVGISRADSRDDRDRIRRAR